MATDPNDPALSSENKYVGLSPLTMDDVRNFFDSYIKPFAPYQEEKIYDTLISNLTQYYYNQAYFNIPSELKQMYEEINIESPAIYNQLLIAIGVPSEIIDKISFSDKIIFLKMLSDFERYRGTIKFFQKVLSSFSDRLSLYELYIDLEDSNWVFKPVKIYLHEDMELNITSIPYDTIQSSVPSLLVSKEQLTSLYEQEKVILPIKSNLLLMDNDLTANVSVLYDVIVSIFLHTYKDNYIDLYFKEDSKVVQLKTIYFLWFYLLTECYEIPWTSFAAKALLKFVYGDIGFPAFIGTTPTTIENLADIIARYNEIQITNATNRDFDNSKTLFDSFQTDISNAFYTVDNSTATTSAEMYNELVVMNSSLILYINDRISNSAITKKAEINLIMTEIYSSLVLYASTYSGDNYFGQYVDYFLRYLPQILIDPENTTSYTILYNLKPYHVDLYSTYSTGVRCQDKFNQIFIDDENGLNFISNMLLASVFSFSEETFVDYTLNTDSSLSIANFINFNIFSKVEDETEEILDSSSSEIYAKHVTCNNISDAQTTEIQQYITSSFPMISYLNVNEFVSLTEENAAASEELQVMPVKDFVSNSICSDTYEVTKVL